MPVAPAGSESVDQQIRAAQGDLGALQRTLLERIEHKTMTASRQAPPNYEVAMIAAQLIAANIMRGSDLASYVKRESGAPIGKANDARLKDALIVAKRLMELSGE